MSKRKRRVRAIRRECPSDRVVWGFDNPRHPQRTRPGEPGRKATPPTALGGGTRQYAAAPGMARIPGTVKALLPSRAGWHEGIAGGSTVPDAPVTADALTAARAAGHKVRQTAQGFETCAPGAQTWTPIAWTPPYRPRPILVEAQGAHPTARVGPAHPGPGTSHYRG